MMPRSTSRTSLLPSHVLAFGYGGPAAPQPGGYNPGPYSGGPGPTPGPVAGGGLTPNAAAALAYGFGILSGIIFLVIEPYKRNPFVRFAALQSIFFNLSFAVLRIVAYVLVLIVPALLVPVTIVMGLVALAFLVIWVLLIVKSVQGQTFVLPVIGPLAQAQARA